MWLCVCSVCVCVPLFLNTSHIPPLSQMGQQVSRSLARTLHVLFLNQLAASEGLSVTTAFPISSNSSTSASQLQKLHFFIQMIWTNTVCCLFIIHWLYFSSSFLYNFTCTLCVFLSFWPMPPVDQPRKFVLILIRLLVDLIGPSLFCPSESLF